MRRSNLKEDRKGRGRKWSSENVEKKRLSHQAEAHVSLAVMEDADEESVIRQTESAQSLIGKFFQLIKSGDIEHYLSEYTPAAQAHLIDEIKTGVTLLEEIVSKNKIIEVNPFNWFMNSEPRSNYVPHIRFWCRGQIAVSARRRIDDILSSKPFDAQAMISEWVI